MFATPTLTQIVLNPRSRAAARDVRNAHKLHQTVLSLTCPPELGDNARQTSATLHRLETTRDNHILLVQSLTQPDPERLPSNYGAVATKPMDNLVGQLDTGVRVRYRLRATPVRYNGHKPIIQPGDDPLDWWKQRAPSRGLELHTTHITHTGTITGRKTPNTPRIVHRFAQYEGTATVTDRDTALDAITHGIGRGRAYGLGLLSIALLKTE
ncbi:type I-E CRISPR-associated protein Cas6/Cse3/CasE [Prauserella alba]|uniref:CRISPR system Cascade subunit CasE n=1 Tax=Prauserella alba TaxID=176898 RepID=A0ABN1VK68_9PSEU|nr:type I-E CRISPR-associated protein Cas6/Cse3/CasE [Prauserella alba]MCP2182190.1 CRISPR system Cascade subunit CasE [Prauserella alba]